MSTRYRIAPTGSYGRKFLLFTLMLLHSDLRFWSAPWICMMTILLLVGGSVLAIAGAMALGRERGRVGEREGGERPSPAPPGACSRANPIYLGLIVASAGSVLSRERLELIIWCQVLFHDRPRRRGAPPAAPAPRAR